MIENFPYTNLSGLNLDWILEKIKELEERIEALEGAQNEH